MDGQNKIVNSIVLDLLKNYVNEIDQRNQLEKYLLLVEYAYNNTMHSSTGKSPFEIIEGKPKFPIILQTQEQIFTANECVQDVRDAFQKIKEALK